MRNGNSDANAMTELAGQLSTDCDCVDSVLGHFTVEYVYCLLCSACCTWGMGGINSI